MAIDKPTPQTTENIKSGVSNEDIEKSKLDTKNSQKISQVNNILQILDFPDNQEESFRKIIVKQDVKTLKNLTLKSKNDILIFLVKERTNLLISEKDKTKDNDLKQKEKQSIKSQRIEQKITKIKSVFTNDILNKNPEIRDKFNTFDSLENPLEKDQVLKNILELLKQPGKLKSIIDSLGGADKNNPKYQEFKNSLVGLDSSFESYFNELENIDSGSGLNTNDVISEIENESGGLVNIDLNSNKPISKMSLVGSEYSFDEEIDKQALNELMSESQNKIKDVQNNFSVLKGLDKPFNSFLNEIKKNWGKIDLKENIQNATSNFSREIFNDLGKVYKDMGIKAEIQINESDISSFKNTNSASELKTKIENIKEKLLQIKKQVGETQSGILKDYKQELKELVKRKEEVKRKQLEVLEFMKNSGFDLIPKNISNRIIKELQSNTLAIPGLELNRNNIDLKNGHFGETGAFVNKEEGINIESKRNLVKLVNKLISGDINDPLSVEAIANGTSVSNPAFLKGKFLEDGIVDGLGWKYGRIISNLNNGSLIS